MQDFQKFLDLAYLPEDEICVSNNEYGYHSLPISQLYCEEVVLASPNEKVTPQRVSTKDLIFAAHNPIIGFRKDSNVTRYQNFFWEMDTGSQDLQRSYINQIGLPYSSMTWSGGKSIHVLTCLEEPITKTQWKLFVQWGLNIGTLLDQQVKSPSRSIRIPGAIRPETGQEQKLIEIKGKVKLKDFTDWLEKYPHLKPKPRSEQKVLTSEPNWDNISPWCKYQLKNGIDFKKLGGRNKTWFSVGCELYRANYDEETAISLLKQYFQEESDFKESEFLTSIRSAYKYMSEKS